MTTLEQRIAALEQKKGNSLPRLIVSSPDKSLTPEQLAEIAEAEAIGRRVLIIYNAPPD